MKPAQQQPRTLKTVRGNKPETAEPTRSYELIWHLNHDIKAAACGVGRPKKFYAGHLERLGKARGFVGLLCFTVVLYVDLRV